ncbi:MAG: lytic murein transglycosylase [Patescibacteria group bacterium]|nr:lytic murein transglycosylase [Patescibacteria group bacterium]
MQKPKVVIDLKLSGTDVRVRRASRVDLSESRMIRIPFVPVMRFLVIGVAVSYLIFGTAVAPIDRGQLSLAAQTVDSTRQQLESQLQDLENQIAQEQDVLDGYQNQGASLQNEINATNAKIKKLNLQIQAITLSIKSLGNQISDNQDQIQSTQSDIDQNKLVLTRTLQSVYANENLSMVEVLLQKPTLSDFFGDMADLITIQSSLKDALQKGMDLRDQLVSEKEALALQKNDAEQMQAYQASQKQQLNAANAQKTTLLKETQSKISQAQQSVQEKQKQAAQIRNQIFTLLGGGQLAFGDAAKLAQVAESATGVPAAFILAILTQESSINGVIGANLGKCYYNDPRNNASGTVMSNTQKPIFLALMATLKLDPDKTPVSCPIVSDGAYGGAMGPAQFMPSTWQLYANDIASVTGNNPPSPFNNLDAFAATALYLKNGLTSCKAIYRTTFSQESCAAAKYYAGGNWKYYMSVGRYGYRVADRASTFADDIAILDSSS